MSKNMTLKQAIKLATKDANDPFFRIAAVTKDNAVVTGLECIEYQKRQNNIKIIIDGGWEYVRRPDGCGWVQRREKN
jgi:hypothetical protein